MRTPRLYAHRGAGVELPENTLEAFQRALELGADALEMDLHLSGDGVIVVSHDDDGERMCGVAARIRDSSLAEIQSWDAGHGFIDSDGGRPFARLGHQVPTFEKVLDEFPDVVLNVDMKERGLAGPLLELLSKKRAEERVIIASFDMLEMLRARLGGYPGETALPRAELIAMLYAPRALCRRLPLRGNAAQIPIRSGRIALDSPRVISRFHELELRVDYWTINDRSEAERLLALGADGIMTDDPRTVAPAFAAYR